MGKIEEAFQNLAGAAAKVDPAGEKRRGGSPDAQGRIRSLKKLALELFHNSSPQKARAWSVNQQTRLTEPVKKK